jgi:hypothetical protein
MSEKNDRASELFGDFLDACKNYDYGYLAEVDLEKWKKGINQEYLMRKLLKAVIDEFGVEEANRIQKIVLEHVENVMTSGVIHTQIKMWFYPFTKLNDYRHSKQVSLYKLKNHDQLKNSEMVDKMG